jgi:glycosyltransferase involved in cell wall biosynthesis
VGNVKPNKNLGLLLRAFKQVQNKIPHRLVIVGRISGMRTVDDEVVREAASFGDRVHLTGEVSDAQLMQYYRGAEAFVFPSLYEGFGLPLLEAMSLGCPVLCSNSSSLPEVAGDAALYFDPKVPAELAKAMLDIAGNETLRTALVEKGSMRLSMFRYSDCARRTAEVLNKLMAEGKRP